jgi:tape measure domain-containing protein
MSDITTTKEIDERVVSMRFDNEQFEKGTRQTLSTIEKLKSALKFGSVSSGFKNIASETNVVNKNMEVLGQGVRSIQREFDSLSVIGATALVRLTNSAIDTGKMIANALTLEPVKTGFDEYETKMGSIQTILTNTKSKGTTLDEVIEALDTLNIYADKTIYNFKEMTRNIGTFTAAGIGLEDAVSSIQGIANLAAASGSTSQQASTAMYQLSQALASGTVKLMDWNSVVNAGMGGELFQEALKETAREYGEDVDAIIEANGSFRESLKDGWLTADVLNTTLSKFTKEGAAAYAQAMLESGEYTQEQADALKEQAEMMEDAATKVKTLTQLWDTLKETAQSGWAKTWEIIIGDFDQAKELFTSINNVLSPWLDRIANARNDLLSAALGDTSKWEDMLGYINSFGVSTKAFEKELENVVNGKGLSFDKMLEDAGDISGMFKNGLDTEYAREAIINLTQANSELADSTLTNEDRWKALQKVVDDVWRGDYKNAPERYELLADAGYDYAIVQDLVNQTVDHHRLTLEELTDEQLRSIGLTQEEIDANRQLNKEAKKRTGALEDYLWMLGKEMSGREVMIEGLKNLFLAMKSVIQPIAEGFKEVFASPTAVQIYKFLWAFKDFTEQLILTEGQMDALRYTAIAVFNVIDAFRFLLGTGLRLAFKIVQTFVGALGLDLSGLASVLADATGSIRDFIKANDIAGAIMQVIGPTIAFAGEKVGEFIKYLQSGDSVIPKIVSKIKEFVKEGVDLKKVGAVIRSVFTGEIFKGTKFADTIEKFLAEIRVALENGFNFSKINFFDKDGIKTIGEKIINGLKESFGVVSKWMKSVDIGALIAGGSTIAIALQVGKTIYNITKPLGAMGRMFDSMSDMFDSLTKNLDQMRRSARIRNLLILASAIMVLTLAITKLCDLPTSKMWSAVAAILMLGTALTIMSVVISKAEKLRQGERSSDVGFQAIIGMTIAMLGAAVAIEKLGKLDETQLKQGIKAGGLIFGAFAMLVGAIELFEWLSAKQRQNQNANDDFGIAGMLIGIGVAFVLMAEAVKIAGHTTDSDLNRGMIFVVGAGLIMALFIKTMTEVQKDAHVAGFGVALVGCTLAMIGLVGVIKLASKISREELLASLKTIVTMVSIITMLSLISQLAGDNVAKAGIALVLMMVAIAMIPIIIKTLSILKVKDLDECAGTLTSVMLIMGIFVALTHFAGKHAAKAGVALLAMTASMALMVGIMAVIGFIKEENIKKAKGVIQEIMFMFILLVAVTSISKDAMKTILAMTAAIALVAGVFSALTLIDEKKIGTASLILVGIAGLIAGVMWLSRFTRTAKLGPIIAIMSGVVMMMGALLLIVGIAAAVARGGNSKDTVNIFSSVAMLIAAAALLMIVVAKASSYTISGTAIAKVSLIMVGCMAVLAGVAWLVSAVGGNLGMNEYDARRVLPALAVAAVIVLFAAGIAFVIAKAASNNPDFKAMLKVGAIMTGIIVLFAVVAGVIAIISKIPIEMGEAAGIVGKFALIALVAAAAAAIAVFINNKVSSVTMKMPDMGKLGVMLLGIVALMVVVAGALALISKFKIDVSFDTMFALLTSVIVICAVGVGLALAADNMNPLTGKIGGLVAMVALVTGVAVAVSLLVLPSLNAVNTEGLYTKIFGLLLTVAGIAVIGGALAWLSSILPPSTNLAGVLVSVVIIGIIAAGVAEHVMGPLDKIEDSENLMTKIKGLCGILIALAVLALISQLLGAIGPYFVLGAVAIGLIGVVVEALVVLFANWVIPELAKQSANLVKIGVALGAFGNAIRSLSPEHVEAAKNVVSLLAELSKVVDNLQWMDLFHKNWQEMITNDLIKFAECCNEFSDKLVEGNIDQNAIDCAAKCIEIYKLLNDNLPTSGGWSEKFTGVTDFNQFGDDLTSFAKSIVEFANELKEFQSTEISPQQIEDFANMCLPLMDLQKKLYGEGGWKQKILGEKDLVFFGRDLLKFYSSIDTLWNGGKIDGKDYKGIKDVDWAATDWDPFIDAATKVIGLGDIIPNTGGLLGDIVGNNDMDSFGVGLPVFGQGLAGFNDKVSGKTWSEGAYKSLYNCMSWLGPMIETYVPKENGWIQNLLSVGTVDLKSFSEGLGYFGEGLQKFYEAIGTETQAYRIEQGGKATVAIDTVMKHMPSKSDMADFVKKVNYMKENDVTTKITDYFKSISDWTTKMVLVNTTDVDKSANNLNKLIDVLVKTSSLDVQKLKEFPDALNKISEDAIGKFISAFDQKSYPDASAAAEKFVTKVSDYFKYRIYKFKGVGKESIKGLETGMLEGINEFADSVKENQSNYNMAAKALGEISKLVKGMPTADEWEKFETSNKYFLDNSIMANATMVFRQLSSWYSAAKDVKIDDVKTTVGSLNEIVKSFSGISKDETDNMTNVANAVNSYANVSLTNLETALTGDLTGVTDSVNAIVTRMTDGFKYQAYLFKPEGRRIIQKLIDGFDQKKNDLTRGINSVCDLILNEFDIDEDMYKTGMNTVQGFVDGMLAKYIYAIATARNLATSVKTAVNETLAINSPSKVMIPSGEAVCEGIALGIIRSASTVTDASKTLADETSTTLAGLMAETVENFDDSELNPVITPVLNLDEVQNGFATINDMMNNGITRNITLPSMYRQSTTDDVIYAIGQLGEALSNVGGDTYNVNGITYDDGSNISSAVQQLIYAANIARRT